MKNAIEVIARGVCVKAGRLLLCQTKGQRNTYLPGGHIEFKEGAVEALCRELEEELAVQTRPGKYLGTVEHLFERDDTHHCEINVLFEVFIDELDPSLVPAPAEDYIEFYWAGLDELETFKLEPLVLIDKLPEWLEGDGGGWASTHEETSQTL